MDYAFFAGFRVVGGGWNRSSLLSGLAKRVDCIVYCFCEESGGDGVKKGYGSQCEVVSGLICLVECYGCICHQ